MADSSELILLLPDRRRYSTRSNSLCLHMSIPGKSHCLRSKKSSIGSLTLVDLKAELRKRHAKVTGKKKELVERLLFYVFYGLISCPVIGTFQENATSIFRHLVLSFSQKRGNNRITLENSKTIESINKIYNNCPFQVFLTDTCSEKYTTVMVRDKT